MYIGPFVKMRVSSYLTALKFENILPPILKIKYTNIPQILFCMNIQNNSQNFRLDPWRDSVIVVHNSNHACQSETTS